MSIQSDLPITDVAVTHSETPPGNDFSLACKVTATKDESKSGYLWVKRGKVGPLTSLRIDHGAPDTTDFMYGNCDTQLNPGSDLKSFLAFQCSEGSPIIDIILLEDNNPVPSGYNKIFRDVYRTARKQGHLAFKTVESARFAIPSAHVS